MAVGATAWAQPEPRDGRLVSPQGLTLYTFDNDVAGSGRSVCNPPCSGIFRPYLLEPGARPRGEFSAVGRDDGSLQLAFKGKPLYF